MIETQAIDCDKFVFMNEIVENDIWSGNYQKKANLMVI
jgi:hypothetical protein